MAPTWSDIASKKQKATFDKIPKDWLLPKDKVPTESERNVLRVPKESEILTKREVMITETSMADALQKLRSGKWSSVEVTEAICKRAAIAHQLTNCLTEIFFEEGLARAKELDESLQKNGKPIGPLHGLPVSIKDLFNVNGYDSTLGFVAWADSPHSKESELVTVLRDLGAVLYCKTNVPTAMMMAETFNNLFGRTTNPYNRLLSPGGSSGGESALLALHGSFIGVGTDIGGSVRIPGAFTNLYSLRPSFGRFPTYGSKTALAGQEAINSVNGMLPLDCPDLGPLGHSPRDIKLYSKIIVDTKPWLVDPKVVCIPWRSIELPAKLSFAVIKSNKVVSPLPPVARGMEIAISKLKEAGHEIIEWELSDQRDVAALSAQFYTAGGASPISSLLTEAGEPFPKGLRMLYDESMRDLSVTELWKLQIQRSEVAKQYLDAWNNTAKVTASGRPIDAIISPVTPYPAVLHDEFKAGVAYSSLWNMLDYPCATFPVTFASAERDPRLASYIPISDIDKVCYDQYDPEKYDGGPVGLQVIGRRFEEEKVLDILEIIAQTIGKVE